MTEEAELDLYAELELVEILENIEIQEVNPTQFFNIV